MSRVYIVVEGRTEQTFVRDVLAPYMGNKGIYLYPRLIGTPGHKGGFVKFKRAEKDIGLLLKQEDDTYVSTMFDFFRISPKWPGVSKVKQKIENGASLSAGKKAEILEKNTFDKIIKHFSELNPEKRFIPYIEMHEFEALLFSDADILSEKTDIDVHKIRNIIKEYDSPEEINDDPVKAPGKRLTALKDDYQKVLTGKVVTEAIGISTIRKKCFHFNDWLLQLENIKEP